MEIAAKSVIQISGLLLSALGLHNKVPALHLQNSTGSFIHFHHKAPKIQSQRTYILQFFGRAYPHIVY